MQRNYNQHRIISPYRKLIYHFSILITLTALLYPQFGINNWIHTNIKQESEDFSKTHFKFYNISNLTFIEKSDSNQITEFISGVRVHKVSSNLNTTFDFYTLKSEFKISKDLFQINFNRNYENFKSKFEIKRFKNFTPTLLFSVNNSSRFSSGLSINYHYDKINIYTKRYKFYQPYNVGFKYEDYIYSINDIIKITDEKILNITFDHKLFDYGIFLRKQEHGVDNNSQGDLRLYNHYHNDNDYKISLGYKTHRNHYISAYHQIKDRDLKLYFMEGYLSPVRINLYSPFFIVISLLRAAHKSIPALPFVLKFGRGKSLAFLSCFILIVCAKCRLKERHCKFS